MLKMGEVQEPEQSQTMEEAQQFVEELINTSSSQREQKEGEGSDEVMQEAPMGSAGEMEQAHPSLQKVIKSLLRKIKKERRYKNSNLKMNKTRKKRLGRKMKRRQKSSNRRSQSHKLLNKALQKKKKRS